jgi:hypothetical protein
MTDNSSANGGSALDNCTSNTTAMIGAMTGPTGSLSDSGESCVTTHRPSASVLLVMTASSSRTPATRPQVPSFGCHRRPTRARRFSTSGARRYTLTKDDRRSSTRMGGRHQSGARGSMPSTSLQVWRNDRRVALDELEAAHRSIGGIGRGRRYATQQINQAYAVLLSSQFQGFCRDLHDECSTIFVQSFTGLVAPTVHKLLVENRKLDKGNPSPSNIGADYNRFGPTFWAAVRKLDARNEDRQEHLEELNLWRNAIAHQDFSVVTSGATGLRLRMVRDWRSACNQLAGSFDRVMRDCLLTVNGVSPW